MNVSEFIDSLRGSEYLSQDFSLGDFMMSGAELGQFGDLLLESDTPDLFKLCVLYQYLNLGPFVLRDLDSLYDGLRLWGFKFLILARPYDSNLDESVPFFLASGLFARSKLEPLSLGIIWRTLQSCLNCYKEGAEQIFSTPIVYDPLPD